MENGLNVSNSSGYNLEPYAVDLVNTPMNPSSKYVYIDPENGMFVLPRPSYWNRCESTDCLTNPDISNSNETSVYDPFESTALEQVTGKFNNAIRKRSTNSYDSGHHLRWNFRDDDFDVPEKGTFSFWIKSESGYDMDTYVNLKYFKVQFVTWPGDPWFRTSINGSIVDTNSFLFNEWNHLYIIWDTTKLDITAGKSLVVYLNGVEKYSTTLTLNTTYDSSGLINCWDGYDDENTSCTIDNIQMWDNEVVSETPDWLYNGGIRREDAMHFLYGPVNGYNPENVQVGYWNM